MTVERSAPDHAVDLVVVTLVRVNLDTCALQRRSGLRCAPGTRRTDMRRRHRDHAGVVDVEVRHERSVVARRVAHAGSAARRHEIGFRKRARVAQDGAAYGFRDVGGVVVALDQPPETRLQIRRAGNDDVREPIKVHRPSERLPVHARVPGSST